MWIVRLTGLVGRNIQCRSSFESSEANGVLVHSCVVSAGPPTHPASGCHSPTGFAPGVAAERRHR